MQRIGESRWRPLELCYWPDQGALPAKGKEYPGLGYKRLRDKPPKAQPAEAQAPPSKQRQPFKPARGSNLRAAAASADDAASEASVPAPAAARVARMPLSSLKPGAIYEGTVTKVDTFGAFVNFGAERDGLVHISQLSDKFVESAAALVAKGDVVRVRLMSVDATAGRVALSMRGLQAAGSAEVDGDEDDTGAFEDEEFDVGGEEEVEMDDDDSLDMLEPGEGMEFVAADEEPDIIFEMAEDDPEMTMEAVAAFEALEPEQISREVIRDVMPVPMGELISGKVSRIEEYGMFIEFDYGSRKRSGLLVPDEAKVPSASLTPEELAELVEEGEPAPQYVEIEINGPLSQYYNIGDPVDAFVLAYDEQGKMSLTQFADWEVDQAAAQELDAEDLPPNFQEERDPLSVDPFSWVDDDDTAATEEETEEATDEAFDKLSGANGLTASELREEVAGTGFSRPLFNQDVTMTFPSRPLNRVDATRLNVPLFKDEDQEGDIVELQDLWQETFHVPKKVHKALGLRFKYNEAGEPELVDKEGAEAQELSFEEAISGSHDDRVAAFVKDLLDDDEDEAEVPVLAMRRPVVLAAAVQSQRQGFDKYMMVDPRAVVAVTASDDGEPLITAVGSACPDISAAVVKELRIKTGAGMMDCKKALAENDSDMDKAIEWLRKKGLAGADKKSGRVAAEGAIAAYIHPGSRLGVLLEVNCETDFVAAGDKFQSLVSELGMVAASCPDVVCVSADEVPAEVLAKEREVEMGKEDLKSKPEAVRAKIVEGRLQKARDNMSLLNQASLRDPTKTVSDIIKESIAAIGENIQVRRFVRFNLGEGLEKRSNDFAAEVAQQTQAKAAAPAPPKPAEAAAPATAAPAAAKPAVQVAASVVKELREKTGAGMMDCKRALAENAGDMEASVEWLRKKGLAGADKKAGRVAAEGAITAYIHPGSRLGVLLEVNCETDFVAASEKFNALASSIAMQIAASPGVQYVSAEDIPAEVFAREKEIEMGREDLKNKPDAIRAKIAEGRVAKLGQEMALLPQPYLMDPSKTVEQVWGAVKEAVATIGEKISVRRFIKFQLGEGIEKKSADFAAEVAAVTGANNVDAQPSPAQPSPAQPSPAQPSPAQPSPAQPSPAQPSPAQPSPAQPSPAQPSPAQPSPAQPSPAQPSPAQPSPAQPSPAQPSPAQPSPAQPSPAQPSPAQPSPAQPSPAQPSPAQPSPAQPSPAQPSPAQPSPAQPSPAQPSPAQPSPAQPSPAQPSPAQPSPAQPSPAQPSPAQPSPAQPSPAQPSPAQPSPAQPSPAQPSPAQPSPAQPSPAQPSPAQPSPAQPSPAQPSPAQPSPAQPSPAQPSPAQPSPAQPSPAQPSPAQPSPAQLT
ncbi:hypothetical protein QJQ45_010310 [Haematococcus lacustris]|nr:hypothetical protein QJQ45_010310 [Haematococcus lacustris]